MTLMSKGERDGDVCVGDSFADEERLSGEDVVHEGKSLLQVRLRIVDMILVWLHNAKCRPNPLRDGGKEVTFGETGPANDIVGTVT